MTLRLPSDNLGACAVLCDNLVDLGPIEDDDGMVGDRVRNAHRLLVEALGVVEACLPKRGEDWHAVADAYPCVCTPRVFGPTGHRKPCRAGQVRWVHVNDTGEPGCSSCRRIDVYSATVSKQSGLCQWCYRWSQAHNGTLPLPGILKVHDRGGKVTNRVVAEAEAAERRAKHVKRKKAKR